MSGEWRRAVSWTALFSCVLSAPVLAQTTRSQIVGSITDETGAALPGVTVTLTSPALQVPQVVRISETGGEYQFVDLPAGTYNLSYELTGFGKLLREGIVLTTAFTARVNVTLKLSSVSETITVSGQTPLVDVTNTRGGTTVSKELISRTPGSLNYQDVLMQVSGTQGGSSDPPLTGQIAAGRWGGSGRTYGASGGTNMIE